jgi:hypothetical protein
MEKIWFVIRNDKHLGPFTLVELSEMSEKNKIDDNSQIWKNGFDSSKKYKDILLDLEGVPDLPPPLPIEALSLSEEKPTFEEIAEETEELAEVNSLDQVEQEIESIEVDDIAKSINMKRSLIKVALALIPIALVLAGYLSLPYFNKVTRPSKMLLSDFKSLETIIEEDRQENQFEFYVSKDRSSLWMGTNISYTGDLVFKFSTVNKKHLGEEEVEAIAYGKLENHIATFDSITFSKGQKIHEGFYTVEVYTVKALTIPFAKKYLSSKKNVEFRYFNTVYLGHLQIERFQQILSKRQADERKNENKFWEELRQKYLTIKMISLQIQAAIQRVFEINDLSWKKKVSLFEDEYKSKYGDFFTSFVIANEKSYNILKEKDFTDKLDIISNYTKLSRIAKNIGTHTMSVLHSLEMATEQTSELQSESEARLKGIISICDQKIEMIDAKRSE